MRRILGLVCAVALGGVLLAFQPDASFYVKPGDTVVFYGDSITDQRLYTTAAETFIVTRYPKLKAKFIHSGWGGDRVSGGGGGPIDLRLQRDVIAYKPTVMTIMLGMNDGGYANHTAANDEAYYNGYRHIVDTMRAAFPGLRITAIEPSPYDDVTRPFILQPAGYNAILVQYGEWSKKYAGEAKFDVADLNTNVVATLKKALAADPANAAKIVPDRVHPALAGCLVMAEELLKAWGARPVVSSVTIDAATGKATVHDRATISDLKTGASITWTEQDESLPFPLPQLMADKVVELAVKSSDITEALNQEPLRVTGLSSGNYTLKIDGKTIGTWNNADWANGVNLGLQVTPMSAQAMAVHDLTLRHNDIHYARWRTVQVPLAKIEATKDLSEIKPAMQALDALELEVVAQQQAAAQPQAHTFEIAPAS